VTEGLAEAHDELRSVARSLLAQGAALTGTPGGATDSVWGRAADAGWLGLEVPESMGGSGATFSELAIVLEEAGRAAAGLPIFGTAVLGVGALLMVADDGVRSQWLTGLASGRVRVTVAVADATGQIIPGRAPFFLRRDGDGALRLSGASAFVPDVEGADRILVVAACDDHRTRLVSLPQPTSTSGPAIVPHELLDVTRRFAAVRAQDLLVAEGDVWEWGCPDGLALQSLCDRAALALASDSLGMAAAMLDETVDYAKQRVQFGRPIGSFQAVKHGCADMFVAGEISRSLLHSALDQCVIDPYGASIQSSMAKSYICDMAAESIGKALQYHGGIGYTWERSIHVFLKRAMLNRALYGSGRFHRRRIAEATLPS
jgi:alkylation response protein AidB-like acyl-CoA dehydrogenase